MGVCVYLCVCLSVYFACRYPWCGRRLSVTLSRCQALSLSLLFLFMLWDTHTQLLLQMSAMLSVLYPCPVPVLSSLFTFCLSPFCIWDASRMLWVGEVVVVVVVVYPHVLRGMYTRGDISHNPNRTQTQPNPVSAAMRRAVRKLNTPSRMLVKFPFGMLLSLRFTRSFPALLHSFVVLVENLPFYRAQSERMTPHVGGIPLPLYSLLLPLYSCHCCL